MAQLESVSLWRELAAQRSLRQIAKEKTGAYQAPYYFTEAAESY
jgi:hypothetical protein